VTEYVTVNSINYGTNELSVTRTAAVSYTAGTSTIGAASPTQWRRPFARLPGSQNGKGVDDPGANGTVTMRSWSGYGPISNNWNFYEGYYGNAAYQNSNFDGSEFWLQFRAKIHANRFSSGRPSKFWFLQKVAGTVQRQFYGGIRGASSYDAGRWLAPDGWPYDSDATDGGTYIGVIHSQAGYYVGGGSALQVGGQYGSTCLDSGGVCLLYPPDEWCTWLIHVNPGLDGVAATTFELFLQLPGESDYRTVLSTSTHSPVYDDDGPDQANRGWNSFYPQNYANEYIGTGSVSPPVNDTLVEFTQIILSKSYIAPMTA
jgi:hypothetical protein